MQCAIIGITHKGEGVARINGKVVFIPFAIPGEVVEIDILEDNKSYSRGCTAALLEPSPERVDPKCLHFKNCGGCAYQHVSYERELQLKQQVVTDSLQRIGKLDIDVKPVIRVESPWEYRNKVSWHIADGDSGKKLGYFEQATDNLLPINQCLLLPKKIQKISSFLAASLSSISAGTNSGITIRKSDDDDKIMLILENCKIDKSLLKKLSGMVDSIFTLDKQGFHHQYGLKYLTDKAGKMLFRLSPGAFFQVNAKQTDKMIDLVKNYLDLQGNEILLDAYCGAGTFSLNMAGSAAKVIGIESFPGAVEDAKDNASLNEIKNCEFIAGECEKLLPDLHTHFDAVIVDPPRAGLKAEVINAVAQTRVPKIVYVSCNPSTMARDLKRFTESGYVVKEVQPLDMFPRTTHVETVILMTNSGFKDE